MCHEVYKMLDLIRFTLGTSKKTREMHPTLGKLYQKPGLHMVACLMNGNRLQGIQTDGNSSREAVAKEAGRDGEMR